MMHYRILLAVVFLVAVTALPAAAVDWVRYVSPTGAFTILMCAAPREAVEHQPSPQGEIVNHLVFAHAGDVTTILGYVDYPYKVDVDQELENDRDNFVREAHVRLVTSRKTTYPHPGSDPLPALEFTASDADGVTNGMIVMVGSRRAYQWTIYTFNGADHTADVEHYLNSFQLATATT
jgi:hypothetical protein